MSSSSSNQQIVINIINTATPEEIWKDVNDFPNYEVSNMGYVRNKKSGKILSQRIKSTGYYQVNLSKMLLLECREQC